MFLLLFLFVIVLTGCGKNSNLKKDNTSTKEDEIKKVHIINEVMNSTVNINTDAGDFGAGFVCEDVYIITNYHVVYNAKDIKVVTYNKEEYKGSLVGYDSENDIAVLKINKKLKSMVLGDSEKVKTGDNLTAIGNPNGDLSFSKAEGKVLDVNPELLDMVDKNRKFI